MILEFYKPADPLGNFIESFIYYKDYNPVHTIDRFLPDGNTNIIIDLTGSPKYIYDNESLKEIQTCRNVWFSGIRNNYITIPSGKDFEMFVINFHKGKSYPFLQMPLGELTDCVVDGELVLTHEILDLREMILETEVIQMKFQAVEKFLLAKFSDKLITNTFVEFGVNKIITAPSQMLIKQIADKAGYSQKHFIKLFRDHVGLTPKSFLKVIRFQNVIQEINEKKQIKWSSIATESGYYDQAHFINDFQAFSGFTPEEYLKKQYDHLNYVPMDLR